MRTASVPRKESVLIAPRDSGVAITTVWIGLDWTVRPMIRSQLISITLKAWLETARDILDNYSSTCIG